MSQIIITIKREKDGYVCVDCDGRLGMKDMIYMIVKGFDSLKKQFKQDYKDMLLGKIPIEYKKPSNELDDILDDIINKS